MAHLRSCEVRQLLHNKFVVIMGDSVQRAVYKDLVVLLQKDSLLSTSQLKAKGELTFEGDILLEGGRWGRMHNGTHYREVRQFRSAHHLLRFYFLTRVFSPYVVEVLEDLRRGQHAPDLVVINSCLWDLSRYGADFRRGYREDLGSLFGLLGRALPEPCLLVWNTAMPVAEVVSGGFLLPEHQHRGAHLRLDVMEANFYSSVEASRHGFDVLDLHFHFRHAARHRQRDGVHWDQRAHRHLSQLLLAHNCRGGSTGRAEVTRDNGPRPGPRPGRPGPRPGPRLCAPPCDLLHPLPSLALCSRPMAKAPLCLPTILYRPSNSTITIPGSRGDIMATQTRGLGRSTVWAPSAEFLSSISAEGPLRTLPSAPAGPADTSEGTPRGKAPVAISRPGSFPAQSVG
ncbi:PREDICTED: PC-esterase domain-containing protein 1B-like [Miniopterus natalensis]|uniref:PC-esterase domain-containing protein 1B-like n=1 Tax=Miniopterus natalensis TaxID=291302 RepID=UPI0007A6BFE7|nr:PREDICTED: PC-esterase domain-containing protein 1B-like [Miniopterus natalensis]